MITSKNWRSWPNFTNSRAIWWQKRRRTRNSRAFSRQDKQPFLILTSFPEVWRRWRRIIEGGSAKRRYAYCIHSWSNAATKSPSENRNVILQQRGFWKKN